MFGFICSHMSQTRRSLLRVVFDVICISLVVAGVLALQYGAKPYHRGFFCDDESIQYPFLSDTVPMPLVACVGICLPVLVIFLLEFSLRNNCKTHMLSIRRTNARTRSWIAATYNSVAVFIFGITITQFLTNIGKYSIGRLRPHFLTLCKPDLSKFNCSSGYITADVCTHAESFTMMDARLSFPSGHSSFSTYCMLYLILYIQARIVCKGVVLLKPFVQLNFFSMGFFTCLSRVSDYKHHWSDVLTGTILGMGVCVCVVISLTDFGHYLCGRRYLCAVRNEYEVPSSGRRVEECSETSCYESMNPNSQESQERQQLLHPNRLK